MKLYGEMFAITQGDTILGGYMLDLLTEGHTLLHDSLKS